MRPAQERNQECLPPKKRDIPVSSSSSAGGGAPGTSLVGGGGGSGCSGVDEVASTQSSGTSSDTQGGATSAEWLRAQTSLHYGVENSENIPAVPVDQYSMLYKVALPSGTYSSAGLHPVLSHISPAYTVHSPLLQHPGIPYPPLGYAQIPHSSLQFVSPSVPYTAVPYAVPPGFVHGSIISPSGSIQQPHTVSHLVPYPSVMPEGVVSPPPQAQVAAHTFTKVSASGGIPLMLTSEQAAAQQHLSAMGVLPATEFGSRGLPVFYRTQGAMAGAEVLRDPHMTQQETEAKINGRDRDQGGMRDSATDSIYIARNSRLLQVAPGSVAMEYIQDRSLKDRRVEERNSPGQRSTPDSDLEQPAHPAPSGATQTISAPTAAPGPCSPSHFMKGAIIQLATGELKRVEDLQTQDFVRSAEVSGGLKIDSSMVVDIRASQQKPGLVALHFTVGEQQSKVTIDVPPEHPFFVFGQGWSSCSPERTAQLYGLACHHLQVGDVCVSITLQQQIQQQQQQKQPQQHHHPQLLQQQTLARTPSKASTTSGPSLQPMGPPAPQQPRLQPHFRIERIYREQDAEREKEATSDEMAGSLGRTELSTRPNRTLAEHIRSQSQSYHLHTEGSAGPGMGIMGAAQAGMSASQRRWSAPGIQRCVIKGNEGQHAQMATRPSFIPQEVKLSIEGRSNAGK
ncbi:hypothetical protein NHX12_005943 [Muraenolepis orangiensis]|uniref:AXH domain-containing protein n=1 Tax=Muraenolepis orangiensis TaxID=630683 RepID=A0A9Q0DSA3_9TELE|nr:hypothetical protein NHX12_005943 [Muraenolepis orangiensis]